MFGKLQKIWNYRLNHGRYQLKQIHNFIAQGGNLILKILVFAIETINTWRRGFTNKLIILEELTQWKQEHLPLFNRFGTFESTIKAKTTL